MTTTVMSPLGLVWPDGKPLCRPVDLDTLALQLGSDATRLSQTPTPQVPSFSFDEFPSAVPRDPGNPDDVGWAVVVADADPGADKFLARLAPLMAHRNTTIDKVLRFPGGSEQDRADWIDTTYLGQGRDRPGYLLLAGGPAHLPFELQASLAAAGAAVGRVDFDEPEHLDAYVAKVLAHEAADAELPPPRALIFATDAGSRDPTHYSARYLAEPIAAAIEATAGFGVERLIGGTATKPALLASMADPFGLVLTASHGMVVPVAEGSNRQREINGAWCCQAATRDAPVADWLVTAADLGDGPIWPGSIVVQFACWGYGTPTLSTFEQWTGAKGRITAEAPFVAAVPKRLLANPQGPIGYVGHVDTAWLHGFADPAAPVPAEAYSPRLEPLLSLVRRALLDRTASGHGLEDLADRANTIASEVTNLLNNLQHNHSTLADMERDQLRKLADRMIRRNDAMWFLFFGDPGVRVRVGT